MKCFSFAGLIFILAGCHNVQTELNITTTDERLLDSLPSGSGAVFYKDSLIIIADDAPFIYKLSLSDLSYISVPLKGYTADSYRIPKPVKPDYECATACSIDGRQYILALGSGSKSPMRDSMLLAPLDDLAEQQSIYAGDLYRSLMQQTNTPAEQWNIEGLAMVGGELLLLNRGNNMVIVVNWTDMLAFIKQGTLPKISSYILQLPSYKGIMARVSGACTLSKSGDLLFCASIEDTPDWHTDGPVLGSYIGIFNHKERVVNSLAMLKDPAGKPVLDKLESVEIIHADERSADFITLADDDQGHTKLARRRITW